MRNRWLFWLPRILVILFALFTMIFSFDVFEMNAPWYQLAIGFLLHNIPFFILMLVLWACWKRPLIGSILFYLVMIALAVIVRSNGHLYVTLIFMIPPFIVGTMLLIEHLQARKSTKPLDQNIE